MVGNNLKSLEVSEEKVSPRCTSKGPSKNLLFEAIKRHNPAIFRERKERVLLQKEKGSRSRVALGCRVSTGKLGERMEECRGRRKRDLQKKYSNS